MYVLLCCTCIAEVLASVFSSGNEGNTVNFLLSKNQSLLEHIVTDEPTGESHPKVK